MKNTLAYTCTKLLTAVKSFTIEAPGGEASLGTNVVKHFFCPTDVGKI
jgi:hypothetical protein